MKLTIDLDLGAGAAALADGRSRSLVLEALRAGLDRQNELTVGQATARRLSFPRTSPSTPEGLRVQTNTLRRSLRRSKVVTNSIAVGDRIFSSIGSNVRYFGIHEFGFSGTVQVRAHERTSPDRVQMKEAPTVLNLGAAARAGGLNRRGKVRPAFGTLLRGRRHSVRAHARQVDMPARRMVMRTIEERIPAYQAGLAAAVRRALTPPKGSS